jgi:predicted XRE-type DNA-binding protein
MTGQRFTSVWDAIEDTPQQAASMKARSALMRALQSWIEAEAISQTTAARLFGVTQPRISDLVRGRINLFSLDTLMDLAATAGLSPHISIKVPKRSKRIGLDVPHEQKQRAA